MRIALFSDTFPPTLNGVARSLGLLVQHANRRGHEVAVVSPREGSGAWPDAALHLRLPGRRLPFYRELQLARPWLNARERRALETFRPEIVHAAVEATVGLAGRRWAATHGIPLVSSYCTNFPAYLSGYGAGFLEGAARAHIRRFHRRAQITFCPSEATRRDLLAMGLHPRLKIWGRGVDSALFHPGRRRQELRERLAPDAEVILMYVGRIAPEKRIDLLLEAFPLIRSRASRRIALVLVGGGPALDALRRRAPEGVHFTGYRQGEELAHHFASADVFLFPSDTETFGQVVTEAMASGLPVVAAGRGGVLDTVIPGETGLLFEPGDLRGLADAALSLVDDPDLRSRLATGARAAAEARSWDAVFDSLFSDYRDVVNGVNGRDTTVTGPTPNDLPSSANVSVMERFDRSDR
jgi:glycosyltransferase involved in cell wall biosynthesis